MADSSTVETVPRDRLVQAEQELDRLLSESGRGNALELLADVSGKAAFVVDREQNIVLFNEEAERLTGHKRGDVLGRHCLNGFRCPECLQSCGVKTHGSIDGSIIDLIRTDGARIRVKKSARAIYDESGQQVGAVEVFDEVGGMGAASPHPASLDEEGKALIFSGLDMLMSAVGRGVLILDVGMVIRRASAFFAELLGVSPESLEGRPVSEVLDANLFAADSPFTQALLAGQRREGWRAILTRPDGTEAAVSVTGSPFDARELCGPRAAEEGRFLLLIRPEQHDGVVASDESDAKPFAGMVARSKGMRQVFQLIDRLHDIDSTVLITGESGTGKELVARAIHARSARADRPFVAVNCGALPDTLLETELFGHARGSFTGALRDRPGRCEVAGTGTLFLDEIGDIPLPLQVKLLRLLQERTYERVGETKTRRFEARVVAATHRDLGALVTASGFREDLYYRLNVVPMNLPPLRARREDLEPLVAHLLAKVGKQHSRSLRLSPDAMRALLSHPWPGNVRQLENALEYATAVCDAQTIHIEDLPPEVRELSDTSRQPDDGDSTTNASILPPALAEDDGPLPRRGHPSRKQIAGALRETRFHRSRAADLLGISRTTLWRRIKELKLDG